MGTPGMRGPLAGAACVAVLAPVLFAPSLIKSPVDLLQCRVSGIGGRIGSGVRWPGCWIREQGEEWAVWVVLAVGCRVIILQTEVASGNVACLACEGFIA